MKINFVLTAFSPGMFGQRATAHIRIVPNEEAAALVDGTTKVLATRVVHDQLARKTYPGVGPETVHYAQLEPGMAAIHLQYRGPPVPEGGEMPLGGMVTSYLIEVEEYQEG